MTPTTALLREKLRGSTALAAFDRALAMYDEHPTPANERTR